MSLLVFVITLTVSLHSSLVYGEVFDSPTEKQIHDFVESSMYCRRIPGLTIAVVKGNEVWTHGYGVADLYRDRPVTNETLFLIASITKSFTMVLLGALLTDKGMNWTAKAVEILGPEYGFSDDVRTREITLRDMLSHRTGLADLDETLEAGLPASVSRAEFCRRLKYVPEWRPFRDGFDYNNDMYTMLGHIAEKLGGDTWENLVMSRLLRPIGMKSTTFMTKPDDVLAASVARPYVFKDGNLQNSTNFMYNLHPAEPAGAILSSAIDISKWMKFLMAEGKTEQGDQLIDKKLLREAFEATVPLKFTSWRNLRRPQFPVSDTRIGYGYALASSVYKGFRRIGHSGQWHCYISYMWTYPEINMGLFVSVNGNALRGQGSYISLATLYYVNDLLFDENPWLNKTTSCSFPAPWKKSKASKNSPEGQYADIKSPIDYVGRYGNQYMTDIVVSQDPVDKQQLKFTMGRLSGILHATRGKDRFLLEYTAPWEFVIYMVRDNITSMVNATFRRGNGKVTSVLMAFEPDAVFEKGHSILDPISSKAACTQCLSIYALIGCILSYFYEYCIIGCDTRG